MSCIAYFEAAHRASRYALLIAVSIAVVLFAAACGGDGTSPGTSRQVASIVVVPDRNTLDVGTTYSYIARALDAQGNEITGTPIAWSSSDATVATIAANGTVTALRAGSTAITATADGKVGSGALDVTLAAVADVIIDPAQTAMVEGETRALVATVKDAGGNVLEGRTLTWTTSAATIAIVSAAGAVTAHAVGNVIIRAASEGKFAESQVRVRAATVDRVELSRAVLTIAQGDTFTLTAVARDANGRVLSGRAFAWSSADPTVATVDGAGTLTAVGIGHATIAVDVEGKSSTADVTVTAAAVAFVNITPTTPVLEIGERKHLRALVRDAQGRELFGRAVQWSVEGDAASISAAGMLTGMKHGYATIKATVGGVVGGVAGTITEPEPYAWDLLYYRVAANGALEIFTHALGSWADPVKLNAGNVSYSPSATPDGMRIAFAVVMNDPATGARVEDIFAVDRNGMHMKQLTKASGTDTHPRYSPDGSKIAYAHWDIDGRSDIWVMNADGTGHVNLTPTMPVGSRSAPAWSPDGSRIAFAESASGVGGTTTSIWTMRSDGTDLRRLTTSLNGHDSSPTWSPDVTRIAFTRYYGPGDTDITFVGVNGGATTRIAMPGTQSAPAWSPDGTYIAFSQVDGPISNLYTMATDGSGVRLQTQYPVWRGGLEPAWIRK